MDGIVLLSVGAGATALAVTVLLVGPVIAWLRRRALLDVPNDRSSHVVPTPRGGGLVVTGVTLVGWAGLLWNLGAMSAPMGALLAGGLALAVVSWLDDMHDLPRRLRFALHIVSVVAVLMLLPADLTVTQGLLPLWADRLLAGLAWLWFINLFNFMDGIDGISGVETTHLGMAVVVLVLTGELAGLSPAVAPMAAVVAGAALGFLRWNWHPAKVFLGDVGSIPLGYLLGWLMLEVALSGAWAVALILPAYYWSDATLTLLRRAFRGASLAVAHREHFYQHATHIRGMGHGAVAGWIAVGNILLFGAALAAVMVNPFVGLALAVVPVGGLLIHFGQGRAAGSAPGASVR